MTYIPQFVSTVVILGWKFDFSNTPLISYYGEFYELNIDFKNLSVKIISFGTVFHDDASDNNESKVIFPYEFGRFQGVPPFWVPIPRIAVIFVFAWGRVIKPGRQEVSSIPPFFWEARFWSTCI